jgi:hypothetical protein
MGRGSQMLWEELREMLEKLGWRKVSEREEVGAVVAGVSFLALSKSKLKSMKIFADLQWTRTKRSKKRSIYLF